MYGMVEPRLLAPENNGRLPAEFQPHRMVFNDTLLPKTYGVALGVTTGVAVGVAVTVGVTVGCKATMVT